ncbi:MAG: anti-sigma factor domain-containing protein [Pelagibaca sp.]
MSDDPKDRADRYVLGLWDRDDDSGEAEMMKDADMAREIGRSRDRFLALDDTADAETPTDMLWPRILRGIEGVEDTAIVPTPSPVTTSQPGGMRQSLMVLALAASLAVAAVLGWMVLTTPEPDVVAVLVNDDGTPFALVGTNDANVTEVTILSVVDIPDGRVMQLWTKPDPNGPPVSVGLIEQVESLVLRSPELPAPTTNQLYEITVEQEGGSPTGLPTGEILGVGVTQPRL